MIEMTPAIDGPRPVPSAEARQALVEARSARERTERLLDRAVKVEAQVRDKVASNHFVELVEQVLIAAAQR